MATNLMKRQHVDAHLSPTNTRNLLFFEYQNTFGNFSEFFRNITTIIQDVQEVKEGTMFPAVGAEKGPERTATERFGSRGMALMPRTKQMLTVLWEQLRLLLQVIYYTFMSVFQMFRFGVQVRITEETVQHIQHMTMAANPIESFSSLFDGDNGVMDGFCADVGDPFTGQSTAEALLSGLHADDLCCGLVDDFVSRTAGKEERIFLGHQSTWKMGIPCDWNIFLSSSDSSSSSDTSYQTSDTVCKQDISKDKKFKQDSSEEEGSFDWSSEEDQDVEFDSEESEESKALWESFSNSSDPYNPFSFSGCISTKKNTNEGEMSDSSDTDSSDTDSEETLEPQGRDIWVSDSDSESSWGSSSSEIDNEENERLWDFFSSPEDPYNPMCFTAPQTTTKTPTISKQASLPAPSAKSETEEKKHLWKSLCKKESKTSRKSKVIEPSLPERWLKHCSQPDKIVLPWKRPGQNPQSPTKKNKASSTTHKKVQFSPVVQVHVMRTWVFARQASRKGHWEEMARDRDRFQRRIRQLEQAIGHCFTQPHREKMWVYLDGATVAMQQ